MKAIRISILSIFLLSQNTVFAKDTKSEWILEEGKNLNEIIYKENGEIISSEFHNFFGWEMIYHIKTDQFLYKCVDSLKDKPQKGSRVAETSCYKLAQPK